MLNLSIFMQGQWHPTTATRSERIGLRYYLFFESAVVAAGILLAARAGVAAGVPRPSEPLWLTAVLIYMACYSGIALLVCLLLQDPSAEVFWPFTLIVFMYSAMPPTTMSRTGAARRRAAYELNQQRLREKFPVRNYPADWR